MHTGYTSCNSHTSCMINKPCMNEWNSIQGINVSVYNLPPLPHDFWPSENNALHLASIMFTCDWFHASCNIYSLYNHIMQTLIISLNMSIISHGDYIQERERERPPAGGSTTITTHLTYSHNAVHSGLSTPTSHTHSQHDSLLIAAPLLCF